jgi:uncharacterized membrane protein
MKRKSFARFVNLYTFFVVAGFCIYAYNVQDNWIIPFQEEKYTLFAFAILMLLGAVLGGIDLAALKAKENKIRLKTIYSGMAIGVIFIVWRLLVIIT